MTLRDRLETRLTELTSEQEAGQRLIADLDSRKAEVSATVVRISGAIQVLREELEKDAAVP
jgi:hypothetical protein